MNKRNSTLGALAIAVAASAIGAGAVVSGNAMADSDPAETATASVSVVSVGADGPDGAGEAIECSFDGVDVPSLNAVEGTAPELAIVSGGIAVGDPLAGTIIDVVGTPPGPGDEVLGQSFSVSVGGDVAVGDVPPSDVPAGVLVEQGTASVGEISDEGVVLSAGELPDGMQVISAADARKGTPDECAEILESLTVTP